MGRLLRIISISWYLYLSLLAYLFFKIFAHYDTYSLRSSLNLPVRFFPFLVFLLNLYCGSGGGILVHSEGWTLDRTRGWGHVEKGILKQLRAQFERIVMGEGVLCVCHCCYLQFIDSLNRLQIPWEPGPWVSHHLIAFNTWHPRC